MRDDYHQTLREYYEIHDAVWASLGQREAHYLADKMAGLMARLDLMNPDWWREPKPA